MYNKVKWMQILFNKKPNKNYKYIGLKLKLFHNEGTQL